MAGLVIAPDDPRAHDVQVLLVRHLEFARAASPPDDVHALDVSGLSADDVSFFSARDEGGLLGIGALKLLDSDHAEIKSMHTAASARGRGVARQMLDHLLRTARARGVRRVSLETGTMPEFAPARALYESAGFTPCEPFGDYSMSRHSTFLTRELTH